VANRTWKGIATEAAGRVRDYLLQNGGVEKSTASEYEAWRVRFSDATVTYYTSGSLTSTPSRATDPAVTAAWEWIDGLSGPRFEPSEKGFLIGLDEAGKGEMFGHTILAGAVIPKHLESAVDSVIGAADTKKKHSFSYWDTLYKQIDELKRDGLEFTIEKIPPWDVDLYNVNKILDVTYQRILARFFRTARIEQARSPGRLRHWRHAHALSSVSWSTGCRSRLDVQGGRPLSGSQTCFCHCEMDASNRR